MVDDSWRRSDPTGPLGGRYDRIAAVATLLLALAMLPLRLFMSHIYAMTFPFVFAAAVILYFFATRNEGGEHRLPTLSGGWALGLAGLTFLGIAAMVLVAALAGERSIGFYNLTGVVGILILGQVLFLDDADVRPGLILSQVLVVAILVRFAALYTTPGVVGIDTWSHATFVEGIRAQHSVEAIETKYIAAPLFHVLSGVFGMATQLSTRNAIYLSVGFSYPLLLLGAYRIGRLFAPTRWALFAVTLFAINAQTIRWGVTLIPTSMALALFVVALLLVVRFLVIGDEQSVSRELVLIALLVVGITLTHQVSSFILLVTLGAIFVAQVLVWTPLFPGESPVNVTGLVTFNAGVIFFVWSFTPYLDGTFTTVMFERLFQTAQSAALFGTRGSAKNVAAAAGGSEATILTKVIAYTDVLSFLMLLSLAVLGSIVVLRSSYANQARLAAVSGIGFMAVFALGFPVLGIPTFVPGRWFAFMILLMVCVGALGVGFVAERANPKVAFALVALILLFYPTTTVLAGTATRDNPVFDNHQIRTGYNPEEIAAVNTVERTTNGDTPVMHTDSPYRSVFVRSEAKFTGQMIVPEGGTVPHDQVIYRKYQSDGAPVVFTENRNATKLTQVPRERVCSPDRSKVYGNDDVSICF